MINGDTLKVCLSCILPYNDLRGHSEGMSVLSSARYWSTGTLWRYVWVVFCQVMIYEDTLKVCPSCLLPGSDLPGHSEGMSELSSVGKWSTGTLWKYVWVVFCQEMIYGDTLKVCLSCLLSGNDLRGHSESMSELSSVRKWSTGTLWKYVWVVFCQEMIYEDTLKVCLSGLLSGNDLRGHSEGMS